LAAPEVFDQAFGQSVIDDERRSLHVRHLPGEDLINPLRRVGVLFRAVPE
jgi:hypothetical protein